MCGITGFIENAVHLGEAPLRDRVRRMAETLRHRGPDGSGEWVDPQAGIALGHRRLAIIDLTPAGAQPMRSACGRFVMTYNGEVYNFRELRLELESMGHEFRGQSDTEVVLAAFAAWGIESALRRLNGMFALALWDKQTRTLTLARDRVGKKPLYYGWGGQTFLFGSELKALRSHPSFVPELDLDALGLFLQYSWIPAPYCIYKHLYKLLPGTYLTIAPQSQPGDAAPKAYWSAHDVVSSGERAPLVRSIDEAADILHASLTQAVTRRMVADVPLGALLSGGVDSSLVVALMQGASHQPVKTFTVGFTEASFNEADHAQAVARHLGTDHTELYVTPEDGLRVIPDLPAIYDEPFADPSQVPTCLISALTRQHVTVALSGDGGDELFAGYKRYRSSATYGRVLRWFPQLVKEGAAALLRTFDSARWALADAQVGLDHAQRVEPAQPGSFENLERIANRMVAKDPQDLLARHHARCRTPRKFVPAAAPLSTLLTDPSRRPSFSDPVIGMRFLDFSEYLPDGVLVKVDRASMATGLEVRCPFLDSQVVELAWRLPKTMLMDRSGGKRILREVLSQYVPRQLFERPKTGFGAPVGDWLRGPLREWAEDLLDEKHLHDQGLFHAQAVRLTWQQHVTGFRNQADLLWSLLMFQAWLRARDDQHPGPGDRNRIPHAVVCP